LRNPIPLAGSAGRLAGKMGSSPDIGQTGDGR
jgi:hypothetical protein